MVKPEEVLKAIDEAGFIWTKPLVIKIAKAYANAKLDQAAENAMVVYHCGFSKEENSMRQVNVGSNHVKADKQSILSLKESLE